MCIMTKILLLPLDQTVFLFTVLCLFKELMSQVLTFLLPVRRRYYFHLQYESRKDFTLVVQVMNLR